MDIVEPKQVIPVLILFFLLYCAYTKSCASPKQSKQVDGCFLKVNLPDSIDFDQAEVIIYGGGERFSQYYAGQTLHFDFGEECNPDEIRIRSRDGKRYRFMYPGINTTWSMPAPMAYFNYYDPDFLATLRR
jgi:hypothetical protein